MNFTMTFSRLFVVRLMLVSALILLPLTKVHADHPITLKFGIYTAHKPTSMIKKFRPITKLISEKLTERLGEKVKIKFKVAPDYEKAIIDLVTGEIDFVRFGPASYITASNKNPDIRVIAVETKNDAIFASGIICVNKTSDITSVEQLKGKSFAFGNELSTIGRYLSQQYLVKSGITAKDLSKYEYLGRHDAVGTAVARRDFDAGALKEKTFKKMVADGQPIRALATFENAPQTWLANSTMDENVFKEIQAILLEITDKKILKGVRATGFAPSKEEYFAEVRTAINDNDKFFAK